MDESQNQAKKNSIKNNQVSIIITNKLQFIE